MTTKRRMGNSVENKKEKRPVKLLIVAGFIVAFLAIGIMGGLAYNQLLKVRTLFLEVAWPVSNYYEALDKEVFSVDQLGESAMLFAMTKNNKYYEQYSAQAEVDGGINSRIQTLDSLASHVPEFGEKEAPLKLGEDVKSLTRLIKKRYLNLGEMVDLTQNPPNAIETEYWMGIDSANIDSLVDTGKLEDILKKLKDEQFILQNHEDRIFLLISKEQQMAEDLHLQFNTLEDELQKSQTQNIDQHRISEEASNATVLIATAAVIMLALFGFFLAKIISDLERNFQLEQKLEAEKAKAEKLAKAKEEFLANMSHEMRTPMNAVMGFADQLAATTLGANQRNLLRPIRHSADLLLNLINDVLDFSKLESGDFELESTGFVPNRLMLEVHELFSLSAKEKGIQLSVQTDEKIPSVLVGDPLRLKQMLLNLAGNAIKFTEKGEVRVTAKMGPSERAIQWVIFEVKDTGIGISPEHQELIFKDFHQADQSTSRKYGGTGLGLAITKKLVDKYGGNISLESSPGKGTAIQLVLPFRIGSNKDVEQETEQLLAVDQSLKGKRVLLADDDGYNRLLVTHILKKFQMPFEEVENGREVVEKLKLDQKFDIILMDLQMPEMDGIETARFIRKHLKLKTPILALTATSSSRDLDIAFSEGIKGYLLKPFKAAALQRQLLALIPGSNKEIPMDKSQNQIIETLGKWVDNDPGMIKHMLNQYLTLTRKNRLLLQEATEKKDWRQTGEIAHKMIPAHRNLALQNIVDQLKTIEEINNDPKIQAQSGKLLPSLMKSLDKAEEMVKEALNNFNS